jgi:serine/threonine-protein kinase
LPNSLKYIKQEIIFVWEIMFKNILKIFSLLFTVLFFAGMSTYVTLTLFIKSEESVIVPNLIDKNVVDVLKILTDLDLNTKVKATEYSEDISLNHIIHQDPEAGSEIKKGRDIRLVISIGTRFIQLPDLRQMPLRRARIRLQEKGACEGKVSHTYHKIVAKDSIIAQVPLANTLIEKTQCVDLLVSQGARQPMFKMPHLVGLYADKAVALIHQSELALGSMTFTPQKYYLQDAVLRQEPAAGSRVPQGTVVNLVINRHAPDRNLSKPPPYASLFKHRVPCGFLKKKIQINLAYQHEINQLFNSLVEPCEEILIFVPHMHQATLYVYEDEQLIKIQQIEVN